MKNFLNNRLKYRVKIKWSSKFAYAIGIIATDGCLHPNGRKIFLSSKDLEMIENFRYALGVKNKIGRYARGGETEKRYYNINVGDKNFWNFLFKLGITPKKSKTIQQVEIPQKYFKDFLRGLFDGDGSFYTFWDRRWPKAFGYVMTFPSASLSFLRWLQIQLSKFYATKGIIKKGDGVYEIRYVKGDTRKLFAAMYYKSNGLCLSRKYHKIKSAFEFDLKLHPDRKMMYAVVAQW